MRNLVRTSIVLRIPLGTQPYDWRDLRQVVDSDLPGKIYFRRVNDGYNGEGVGALGTEGRSPSVLLISDKPLVAARVKSL